MVNLPGRRIRAGDSDRDSALAVLQDAHVAGRLTVEELLERQERVLKAVYTDELPEICEDLPEWRPLGVALAPHGATGGVPVATGNPGTWSATILSGKDTQLAPGTSGLRNIAVMGGDDIHLGGAMGPGAVVTIEVYAVMGGHDIYVPAGVRVIDESQAFLGGNSVKKAARGDGSNGTLVLRGFSLMGGNSVKLDR